MERYSEYKDSGVKWLGEIPSHWEVVPFKRMINIKNGADYKEFETGKSGYPVIGSGGIFAYCDKFVYDGEVVLLGRKGTIDKPLYYKGKFWTVDTMFYGIPYENAICKYLYYQALTIPFKMYATSTAIPSMTQSDLNNNPMCLPSRAEQDAIVRYLDAATSKIDKAIAMQQKMIDLLNERKQIIIQNAVTKGLDENVEMKDSNCKFLGKIPSTWEVCKTLYVLSMPITDGPHTTPQLFDDGIPFVSAEAVSCGNGYIDFSHIRGYISDSFYNECCKKYIPQRDDIYMIKSGATTGKVAIVDTDKKFTIWSPLAVFRVNKKKVLPYFLYYSLQSRYYQLQVQDKWSFGTQQNIGMRMLEKLILCYSSIEEQAKIVEFIKKNVDNFDSAISNCHVKSPSFRSASKSSLTK